MDVAASQADSLPSGGPPGIGVLLGAEAGRHESGAGSPSDGSL